MEVVQVAWVEQLRIGKAKLVELVEDCPNVKVKHQLFHKGTRI